MRVCWRRDGEGRPQGMKTTWYVSGRWERSRVGRWAVLVSLELVRAAAVIGRPPTRRFRFQLVHTCSGNALFFVVVLSVLVDVRQGSAVRSVISSQGGRLPSDPPARLGPSVTVVATAPLASSFRRYPHCRAVQWRSSEPAERRQYT